MDNITIFVNGEALDLWDAEKINISAIYSISDINDIDATKNSITREIKVPATKNNRRIFGYPEDINSGEMITQAVEARGRIEAMGVEVMKGRVKMLKSVTKDSAEFSFNIIGDNGDWRNIVNGVNLKGLDLTDQDHLLIRDNIIAAEPLNSNKLYKYPLINQGQVGVYKVSAERTLLNGAYKIYVYLKSEERAIIPFAEGGGYKYPFENFLGKQVVLTGFGLSTDVIATVTQQQGGTPTSVLGVTVYTLLKLTLGSDIEDLQNGYGTLSFVEGNHRVKVTDMLPAIQVKGLVDRIFKGSGYRIRSKWLDNMGRRLYMLKGTDNGNALAEEEATQYDFVVGLSANKIYNPEDAGVNIGAWSFPTYHLLELDNVETDNAGFTYNEAEHYWTPKVDGRFKFTLRSLITSYPVGNFVVQIVKLALDGYVSTLGYRKLFNDTEPAIDFDFEVSSTMSDYSSYIRVGERVYVIIGNDPNEEPNISNNQITVKSAGCEFKNELYNPEISYNSVISLNRFLPDNTGLELMQGLKQVANLFFLTDVEKGIVYIEPRDEFYSNSVVDWSRKIDLSKDIEIEELGTELPRKNLYSYMQDAQDNRAQRIEDSTERRIGSQILETNNLFAEEELEENINDIFSPTIMDKCVEGLGAIKFNTTEIPYLRNGSERYDFETRLLYFDGVKNLPAGESWNLDGLARTTYPKFFSVDRDNYNYNSLNFDDTDKTTGLATRYYRGLYEQINNSRKHTAYMNLQPIDVEPFVNIDNKNIKDYRARFFLGDGKEGGYYRIDQIQDYSPNSRQTTKVSLVKDTDRGVLPIYPIFAPVLVDMTATDTIAGSDTLVTVTIRNMGSEHGTVNGLIKMKGLEIPLLRGWDLDEEGTASFTFAVPTSSQLTSGSYTVYLEPDATGEGLWGEADFYIGGCTTPAAFIKVGDVTFTPPLNQLSAGMSVAMSFNIKNTGCLTGSSTEYITIENDNPVGGFSAIIPIINLPGGQTTTKTYILENIEEGTLSIKFSGIFVQNFLADVEASNPDGPPIIITKTPAHNATLVPIGTAIRAVWNVPITIQPGKYVRIYRYTSGTGGNAVIAQTVPSENLVPVGNDTFDVFINTLLPGATYSVVVAEGTVKSTGPNINNAQVSLHEWKFTTRTVMVKEIGDDLQGIQKGGTVSSGGNNWVITRSGSAGSQIFSTSIYEARIEKQAGNNKYNFRRFAIYFDTNNQLPPGATLDAAEITMNVNGFNSNGASVVKTTTTILTAASYTQKENVLLSTVPAGVFGLQLAPIPISALNLTGKTGFMFMIPFDYYDQQTQDNTPGFPEWWFRANTFRLRLYYYI